MIFTSDNGSLADIWGGSNAPLRGTKRTTWEGGQRVPCIARWPGHIPPGTVCDSLATAMDLAPTLAGLAGTEMPADRTIDGRDIRALLLDPSTESPHEAFFYYYMNHLEAVRSGRWKLHFSKWSEPIHELYDLETDVSETTNVYDQHPEVIARLEALADRARQSMGDERLGIVGTDVREIGRVDDPRPLTVFDDADPYYMAEYDLPHRG